MGPKINHFKEHSPSEAKGIIKYYENNYKNIFKGENRTRAFYTKDIETQIKDQHSPELDPPPTWTQRDRGWAETEDMQHSIDPKSDPPPHGNHYISFTDGGGGRDNKLPEGRRQGAGWGFTTLKGFTHHNEQFGNVITDKTSPLYIGAEHYSNNTGEITAVYETLAFFEETAEENATLTIAYDSKYAAFSTIWLYEGKHNKQLIHNTKKY